jgi:hypothetical protein
MSREAVEQLMDRWMNEPSFREELRADPEKAVQHTGVALDEVELEALRNMDWEVSDEELVSRVSKGTG